VDPVPDPLLLRKSGSAGNRTRQHNVSEIRLVYLGQLFLNRATAQGVSRPVSIAALRVRAQVM
jgi:hypothetical protein